MRRSPCWKLSAESVAGAYVMPSFGRYEQAADLVRRLRAWLASRPAAGTSLG